MIPSYYLEIYHLILLLFIIVYSLFLYSLKRGFKKKYHISSSLQSVSIVVSMHNEKKNASDCLEKLVTQDYPEDILEIIVVNDRSTDGTEKIIHDYCQKYSFVRKIEVTTLQEDFAPKKYAIDQAIRIANGDIILLTDADGRPTPSWVREMSSYFTKDIGMVLGYAPYKTDQQKKSLWNRLLSLEYLSHASVAAATCGIGYPVTCVGTNMAYKKRVYEQLDGFGIYKNIHTGDDDLFLQRVRQETKWEIAYASGQKAHVCNLPPDNWKKFYQQRIRYASKGFTYPPMVTLILIFFYILNLLLMISSLTLVCCSMCLFFLPGKR